MRNFSRVVAAAPAASQLQLLRPLPHPSSGHLSDHALRNSRDTLSPAHLHGLQLLPLPLCIHGRRLARLLGGSPPLLPQSALLGLLPLLLRLELRNQLLLERPGVGDAGVLQKGSTKCSSQCFACAMACAESERSDRRERCYDRSSSDALPQHTGRCHTMLNNSTTSCRCPMLPTPLAPSLASSSAPWPPWA